MIAAGMVGVLAGLAIANRIVDHLDAQRIRTLTYLVIGLSGASSLAGALL